MKYRKAIFYRISQLHLHEGKLEVMDSSKQKYSANFVDLHVLRCILVLWNICPSGV